MLSFGLGTVPALFVFGSAAHWLGQKARVRMLRTAGLVVAPMGMLNLFRHLQALRHPARRQLGLFLLNSPSDRPSPTGPAKLFPDNLWYFCRN